MFRYGHPNQKGVCAMSNETQKENIPTEEYGPDYEGPFPGPGRAFGMGYAGGALRSRGSYQAESHTAAESDTTSSVAATEDPVDDANGDNNFTWGDGYVGGR